MSRLSIPTADTVPVASKPLLATVYKQLGTVPNLMTVLGHSPAALTGYLSLHGALAQGTLDAGLQERIALVMAEFNGCAYCLSAHDYLGRHVAKLRADEILDARAGRAMDTRTDAALRFARRVAESRGHVTDTDLLALRAAGYGEDSVVEIVVAVALHVLTNYVNNVAQTDIDFPEVALSPSA